MREAGFEPTLMPWKGVVICQTTLLTQNFHFEACSQDRTGDFIHTKDVLYQLSYTGILVCNDFYN